MTYIGTTFKSRLAVVLWTTAFLATPAVNGKSDDDPHRHHHTATANGQSDDDPHRHHRAAVTQGYTKSIKDYEIPDIKLTNAANQKVNIKNELDKTPVVVNFIFTSCTTICPVMSSAFAQLQDKLAKSNSDLRMISISIDPEEDTPEKLHIYSQRFKAGSQWQFFTGDKNDILAVQKAFDTYRGNKMNHSPVAFIRTDKESPWIRLNGFASASVILNEYHKATKHKH